MQGKEITGIQQIGIGVNNLFDAWKWYKNHFGMDVRVFEDEATAELMLQYTGGEPRERHAALAINIQGGGGFEIWQYKGRNPIAPSFQVQAGDLGIFAAKIKSRNIEISYNELKSQGAEILGDISTAPNGVRHFYVKDPFNNVFEVVEGNSWFYDDKKHGGGTAGAIIGVSNIERARKVYSGILGYDKVLFDEEGKFSDMQGVPGSDSTMRRVLLTHHQKRKGGFSRMFGDTQIELIEVKNRKPEFIFKNRFWGDLGFIHLCFDIQGMTALKEECKEKGFPFTVDSTQKHIDTFDMGEAAGHFSYIEDPDGTLIEFVETHRIPIIKKMGWYINLRKRDPQKSLPDWLLKTMRHNRFKG
ncbi:MAG: VOC family protein [Bacteroidetes bacterium]|jgi:catechol 2,3-dioxygenase-like lactoylglutathione lyase family enzyme|nr:VOC family protein [Bacteroidota bacterium]MBT3748651.1 VOC family protein [Bacteroidota bacterium]MBT4401509.1 VOC family protein [Bacteroidota bacterium]MBT4411151.1 VOC family protein [Bacteroidota bacterium]MBT7093219.1 VOC family protein [Bacteroidota bacterium]